MTVPQKYYDVRLAVCRQADRFGRWCDEQTESAYRWRSAVVTRTAQASLQAAGSLAHAVKLLPRLDAVLLRGGRWTAVWVGNTELSAELERLLFPAGAATEHLGRVPAWSLRRFVSDQLAGIDLVACALPKAWPWFWRPVGPAVFSCPIFVNLALDIDVPLESLLGGRARRGLRADYNKSQREGYRWRLTREESDVERFHRDMYLPHVTRRHGGRSLVTTVEDGRRKWIARDGSLLFLEQDGHPVAGVTVRIEGTTCLLGEEGILDALEAGGYSDGVQVGLKCAAIEFARSEGLTRLVMGRSLARLGDPVLANKLRWGAHVGPPGRCLHPEWTFVTSRVSGPLAEHLNRQGLLTFSGGRACVVSLGSPTDALRHGAQTVGRILVVEPGRENRVEDVLPAVADPAHTPPA